MHVWSTQVLGIFVHRRDSAFRLVAAILLVISFECLFMYQVSGASVKHMWISFFVCLLHPTDGPWKVALPENKFLWWFAVVWNSIPLTNWQMRMDFPWRYWQGTPVLCAVHVCQVRFSIVVHVMLSRCSATQLIFTFHILHFISCEFVTSCLRIIHHHWLKQYLRNFDSSSMRFPCFVSGHSVGIEQFHKHLRFLFYLAFQSRISWHQDDHWYLRSHLETCVLGLVIGFWKTSSGDKSAFNVPDIVSTCVQHCFNTFSTLFQHCFNTVSTHFQHFFNMFSALVQQLVDIIWILDQNLSTLY